jgi:hypothetical protein
MDGYNYTGVGIYDPELRSFVLHFEETESGRPGVAQFRYFDGNLSGKWTWADAVDGQLGREVWTAQYRCNLTGTRSQTPAACFPVFRVSGDCGNQRRSEDQGRTP